MEAFVCQMKALAILAYVHQDLLEEPVIQVHMIIHLIMTRLYLSRER